MNKTTKIIIGIVVAVVLFFGGVKYGEAHSTITNGRGTFATTTRGNFAGRTGSAVFLGGGGNGTIGQIVSMDNQSITVAIAGGTATSTNGSIIVFYSPSTTVSKLVTEPASNLAEGDNVIIMGSKNSDGSMSANSIQVR